MRRGLPAAALALWFAPLPARAFVRSTAGAGGPCLFWAPRGHSFQIDSRGTPDVAGLAAFAAVRKSFATWAGATCSDLTFPDLGLSTNASDRKVGYFPGEENLNLVLWRTANCTSVVPPGDSCITNHSCANTYDCWNRGDQVIAVTTTTFNRSTGQIFDADIELNDAVGADGTKFLFTANDGPPCTQTNQTDCVAYDVQNTVTHEAGHSIGFDHSPDQTATMFAYAPLGDIAKRTLHTDDINGVCTIYPKGKPTVTCLGDPITLVQTGPASEGGGGCAAADATLLTALGLIALRWRTRQRR